MSLFASQNFRVPAGLVMGIALTALVCGCQNDEIRQYSVKSNKEGRDVTRLGSYDLPKGWKRQPLKESDKITLVVFRVETGGQSADISITRLQGKGGGLMPNLARWREKFLHLEPLEPKDMQELVKEIKFGGEPADYVDLTGSDKAPADQRRILGVLAFREPVSWFVKMQGPVDLVGNQKKAFESFIESIRFGSTGANDGQ